MRRSITRFLAAAFGAGAGGSDFVTTLMRSGRLADVSMLNHFTSMVQQELQVPAAASTSLSICEPAKDLAGVFGSGEWYCSPESAGTFTVKKSASGFVVTGKKLAAGSGCLPKSIVFVASVEDGNSTSVGVFRATISSQSSASCTVSPVGRAGISASVSLEQHPCTPFLEAVTKKPIEDVPQFATTDLAQRRVKYCNVVVSILQSLSNVVSLHATTTTRYDHLLVKDQSTAKVVSTLKCNAYAVRNLASYASFTGSPVDVAIAKIFAASVLESSVHTASRFIGSVICDAAPHDAQSDVVIPYKFVNEVKSVLPEFLHLDGWNSDVALFALEGALQNTKGIQVFANRRDDVISTMLASKSNGVRLSSPHLNLALTAHPIEKDVGELLHVVASRTTNPAKGGSSGDMSHLANFAALYVGELYASVASIYRCTAALSLDEETVGQQEWLWTQGFCDLSRVRRSELMQRFVADEVALKQVWPSIATKEYDDVAVHPVEVSMMQPAGKKSKA